MFSGVRTHHHSHFSKLDIIKVSVAGGANSDKIEVKNLVVDHFNICH